MRVSGRVVLVVALVMVAALISLPPFAQAGGYSIYVSGQPFAGNYLQVNGDIYLPVAPLLAALKLSYQQTEAGVAIWDDASVPPGGELASTSLVFLYRDRTLAVPLILKGTTLYAAAKPLAQGLGALYLQNDQTGIVDVMFQHRPAPYTPAPAATVAVATPSPSATPTAVPTAPATPEQDPVISAMDQHQDLNPQKQYLGGEWRGTITITNTWSDEVTGVTATLHIKDGYGKDMYNEKWTLGTMIAGQVVKKDFYWLNPNPLLVLKPEVEIAHDPITPATSK